MDYGDHYRGFSRDYYRDPFPHSLLSTRQSFLSRVFVGRNKALIGVSLVGLCRFVQYFFFVCVCLCVCVSVRVGVCLCVCVCVIVLCCFLVIIGVSIVL